MEKYKNGTQTFLILTDEEREAMTDHLVAMQRIINEFGKPRDWNEKDEIFLGMLALNSPIGFHDDQVMAPDQFGLGVDPTKDQYEQANMAIGKMIKYFGAHVGITRMSSSSKAKVTRPNIKQRMDKRRAAMLNWVKNNQVMLRELVVEHPSLERKICHNGTVDDTINNSKIKNLISPQRVNKPQSAEDAIANAVDASLWG